MIPLEKLAHDLDEAYYDNRVRHLVAITKLQHYAQELIFYIDQVDACFCLEASDSRDAIDQLLAYVDVKGLGQ